VNKGERDDLVRLVRLRAKQAGSDAKMRAKILVAGSLESADARAVLEAMPTAEQLMPALSLGDLGVKTWQPPKGTASALLTPSTPADRKRRKALAAIDAHPGWSDRKIAEIAGVDHKTVAAYPRRAGETPAELPGRAPGDTEPGGEFPGDGERAP
jgi:hypothetical protein